MLSNTGALSPTQRYSTKHLPFKHFMPSDSFTSPDLLIDVYTIRVFFVSSFENQSRDTKQGKELQVKRKYSSLTYPHAPRRGTRMRDKVYTEAVFLDG